MLVTYRWIIERCSTTRFMQPGMALTLVWSVAVLTKHVLPLDISWMAVFVAIVVSSGVGVLFGYRPASEAANLSSIEALRME
jgi:ABC-type lipoprotein release transport system permease subunit